jgi:hypothetical protein
MSARTTVLRVRAEAAAVVYQLAVLADARSLSDLATVLIQLGAQHSDEEIAAALEALPTLDRTRGPNGVFRKSEEGT